MRKLALIGIAIVASFAQPAAAFEHIHRHFYSGGIYGGYGGYYGEGFGYGRGYGYRHGYGGPIGGVYRNGYGYDQQELGIFSNCLDGRGVRRYC